MFLNFSLDSLVKFFVKSVSSEEDFDKKFNNLNTVIAAKYNDCNRHPELKLLTRKGVFQYEYIDSYEKLDDIVLHDKMHFVFTLTQEEITINDYEHAKNVWNVFQCNSLKEYLYLYLLCDVLLLADLMENFRVNCRSGYDLDPVYFVSSPHLAWNAMLKKSNLNIELIGNPEIYRLIQPNIRGGICHCSVRYARANNKYMGSLYDSTQQTSYIVCFNINNLYGFAVSNVTSQLL